MLIPLHPLTRLLTLIIMPALLAALLLATGTVLAHGVDDNTRAFLQQNSGM